MRYLLEDQTETESLEDGIAATIELTKEHIDHPASLLEFDGDSLVREIIVYFDGKVIQ